MIPLDIDSENDVDRGDLKMNEHNVKIIVPVTGADEEAILKEAIAIAETEADCVEWRFDLAKELYSIDTATKPEEVSVDEASENLLKVLKELAEALEGKKLLFTIRTKRQGGEFPDNPEVYERLVSDAVKCGDIGLVDLEDTVAADSFGRILTLAKEYGVRTIASYHNFSFTPGVDEIIDKFMILRSSGADILKTAFMPVTPKDVAAVLYATAKFKEEDKGQHEMITMSMGDMGKISRVSGAVFGSDYTFATVGETSAPGQMPMEKGLEMMEGLP